MVGNSKIFTVPHPVDDCLKIKELAESSDAVNLEVQQPGESHDTGTSPRFVSAQRYKLGPCFCSEASIEEDNKPVFVRLCEYYPSPRSNVLVQNFASLVSWNSWSRNSSPIAGWHIPDATYCKWVKKLERRLAQKWRDLRIYEAIILSTRVISFDGPLMAALMCFWDKSCNAFLLSEGPMGITMEDVVSITSCSPVGIELSTLGTNPPDGCSTYKGIGVSSYRNFVTTAMALKDKEQEEMSFYLYWICKFLVCNRSVMILKGFKCVAETIFHAKGPIALAPFLLGLAYNCLGNILRSDFSEHVSGPLWLVLLWAQAYFVPIAARGIAVDLPSSRKQHFNGIHSYGDHIIFSQVKNEKTFGECFNYLTDSRRKRDGEEWNPFLRREFGADWFRSFKLDKKQTRDEKDAWKSVLTARDLPVYFSPPTFFLEQYSPNQFARQLGHIQSVPVPLYQTINQPWHSRSNVAADIIKHAEDDYFTRKFRMSQVHQIHLSPYSDHFFISWWSWYWANVSVNLSEAQKHFVSMFNDGPRKMTWKRPAARIRKLERAHKRRARKVSALLEPSPGGGGGDVEEEEEETLSAEEEEEEEEEEKEEEDNDDDDLPLTKLRHPKPSVDKNDTTVGKHPSSETPINSGHNLDGIRESITTPQQNNLPSVDVEEHRKKLKQYMDMSIESICETDELKNLERTVETIYHQSSDALETPILGDLRKQLTGLSDKIPSLLSSIKSAESERESLCKQNPDLPAQLDQEKLELHADESKLSELMGEEAKLDEEIQNLMAKKESMLLQKASTWKDVEKRRQKIEELKNIEASIKKAEYNCFQRQNEMNKVNAMVNATLSDAKRVLFK